MCCGLAPKRLTAIFFALSCLATSELLAGELIFDPENPGLQEVEREAREPRSELIFDPENRGEESPEEATSRVSGGESSSTLWKLNYEAAALVHPGIGPAGQDPLELLTGLGAELRHDLTPRLNLVLAGRFHYWAGRWGASSRMAN